MLLSDVDIQAAVIAGELVIDPFQPDYLQPASLDVRLSDEFRFLRSDVRVVDPTVDPAGTTAAVTVPPGRPVELAPGAFALASTVERITLGATLAGRLEGKSSLGRLGLLVHATAGFIDPGFTGQVTLELVNVAGIPILLWPGMKIGQLALFRLSGPPSALYGDTRFRSRYQGQSGPTASRAYLDWNQA